MSRKLPQAGRQKKSNKKQDVTTTLPPVSPFPSPCPQVVFIPAHRIPNLDDRDTAATTEILREEMRKGSQSIISYDHCNGSLQKMREDAFM